MNLFRGMSEGEQLYDVNLLGLVHPNILLLLTLTVTEMFMHAYLAQGNQK